ncbi:hypothetical protein WJX79_010418 [Trebouxia sp. C0005]
MCARHLDERRHPGGTASPSKPPLSRSSSTRSNQASGSPRISKDVSRVPSRRTSRESLSGHDDSGTSTSSRKDGAASRAPQGKAGAAAARGPAKTGPQQEIEDRLREEVAIRKKEQQRHAEMLAKEEEDQQKFEALHKQLRGKDYGYDHKGQIVVINNVDPDSLPPVAAAPTVTTAAGEKKQRQNISQKPKDPPADSPKPKPKATLEADGPDFIADNKEVQPPVVDTIKLAMSDNEQLKWARDGVPRKVAAKVVERPPSPVDPTLALLSSADWGLSSAVKGRSPAQLPSKEALDADLPMLKTRDRAFKRGQIASIPVAAGLRSDMATPHVDTYGGSLGWAQ